MWNTCSSPRGVPAGRRQSALWLAGKGQRDAREFRAWWLRHAGIHGRTRTNRDRGRAALRLRERQWRPAQPARPQKRNSDWGGKEVSVRVELGGRGSIKKKKKMKEIT